MTRRVYLFGAGQADGDPERKDILGGKGASLAAMTRAGLPVPPGFTISAQCCQAFLEAGGAWPDGLQQDIREAMAQLERMTGRTFGCPGDPLLVSVRSGAEVSMPGMMDTILNCGLVSEGDPWQTLFEGVEAVFNSWNSPRAVAYRRDRGIAGLSGTAVTIQEMFPSDVSGVVFTANPNDPEADEMLVESAYGLGEAVVSGEVHPDSFVLDRNALTVKRRTIRHTPSATKRPDGSQPDPDAPSLTDPQIRELAELALEVKRLFDFDVDVEWGLGGGQFVLLQARQIRTARAEARREVIESTQAALRRDIEAGRGPWVLHNLAETLAHPTPLTWSVQRRFMSGGGGFGRMYRMAGFEPSETLRHQGPVRLIAGRVYMDTGLAPEMFFADYPFAYDMDLLRCDPAAGQLPPTRPTGTLRARAAAARRVAEVNRRLHELARTLDSELNERTMPEFVEWCRTEKQRALTDLSAGDLVTLWHARQSRVMDELAPQSLLPSLISGMALAELRTFLAEEFWDADEDPDELAAMLAAPPTPDRTLRANAALYALAQGQITVEQWLDDYGHRGPDELDLAARRWRERTEEVVELADRLKDGQDPLALHGAHVAKVEARRAELQAQLRPADRVRFDRLLSLANRYIPFREDGKYVLMLGYDLLRDVAVEAGRRLGIRDDVFFLTADELCEALSAERAPGDIIAARRTEYRAEARLHLPRVIDADAIETLGRPPQHEAAERYPAYELSAGVASGPVRIVTSLTEAGRLGHGYVLVCRSTDPAWTPLFVNAAGLVLECGGALSHGAVVAREMGIPAVVLPDATSLLTEGQRVFVDGHRGSVGTLARAPGQADSATAPNDVRIPAGLAPPPRGRRERAVARLRNIALLVWGAYLLAAWTLPDAWLYHPSMAVLDRLLWPLVTGLGRPATVAVVAGTLAALTMVGQRFLTDNRRLRQAKRRAGHLTRQATSLPRLAPRRAALTRLAAPVNVRLLAAAMGPISLLLGPMIMTFLWFPLRVDPASWSPPPGTPVKIVALVDSRFDGPVTLTVSARASLAESTPASRTVPPVRATLDRLLVRLGEPPVAGEESLEDLTGSDRPRAELRDDLEARLREGLPPQGITWAVQTPPEVEGRFPVMLTPGDGPAVELAIVVGERYPPAPREIVCGANGPIRSARIVYPPSPRKRIFWAPLASVGNDRWDAGWLLTYLIAYLPLMFGLRWMLRVA